MKDRPDLVRGWLRKADSDLANLGLCIENNKALDTACFHAQQAAEKALKAYLISKGVEFPRVHSLEMLLRVCAEQDAAFSQILDDAALLTPFAVGLRYDHEFWPSLPETIEAKAAATRIVEFVLQRLGVRL